VRLCLVYECDVVTGQVVSCLGSELKRLLETSDDDGIRRQARGALDTLGVVTRTSSAAVRKLNHVQLSAHTPAMSQTSGWLN